MFKLNKIKIILSAVSLQILRYQIYCIRIKSVYLSFMEIKTDHVN